MPFFTRAIDAKGPLLNVLFTVSDERRKALTNAGVTVPSHPPVIGLIDTGASSTCVDQSVIQALGLTPTGTISILTPSSTDGPVVADQYDCGLFIYAHTSQNPYVVRNMPVIKAPTSLLQQQGFHALIGRDVLSQCALVYNGQSNLYTLAF